MRGWSAGMLANGRVICNEAEIMRANANTK